jgi:predicted RNA-binding Zn ribbon-like protein
MDRPLEQIRLVGGHPSLDFVNTIHDRHAAKVEDYLSDYARYLGWSVRAGVLTPREARFLARKKPPASLFADVGHLRSQLHALFLARIASRKPTAASLAALDAWLARAWQSRTVDPHCPDWLAWRRDAVDAMLPLKRLALSALDVLQRWPPRRLKCCATRGQCGWLFIDETKNNRRRWCSMDTCGTADKMLRYRRRLRS